MEFLNRLRELIEVEEIVESIQARLHWLDPGVIVAQPDGRIWIVNTKAAAMFGYTRSELSGRMIEDLVPDQYREAHRAGIGRVAAGGESRIAGRELQMRGRRADSSEFPLRLYIEIVHKPTLGQAYIGLLDAE